MKYAVEIAADEHQLEAIIQLRYEVLRKPWHQPVDTARDDLESVSVNAFIRGESGVIACGRLQDNGGGTGQVRYMAVDPGFRGAGLGKLILAALEIKAATKGLTRIELQSRENAVPFYLSQGYSMIGPSFVLWGQIPHFLMEKVVSA